MKKKLALILFFLVTWVMNAQAQCAMCRASVGSNLSEGRDVIGNGLNIGILYLLVTPYILVGLGVYFYRRAARQRLKEQNLI